MKVYFIRHGETDFNKRTVHQPRDTKLSETGRKQAEATAEALTNCSVDLILSSDLPRAVETANIISKELKVPVKRLDLLREIRRPSSLENKFYGHPKTFDYVLCTIWNRDKASWHYEDAESLYEIHGRVRKLEAMFQEMHSEHTAVAVVTHAIFLEIFVKFACKNGDTSFFDYFPIFSPFSVMKNGSITTMEHLDTEAENVCSWELERFNDTSHLRA